MTEILEIRPVSETRWDCASFGEVMLRFDPGFGRVRNSRSYRAKPGSVSSAGASPGLQIR